VITVTASQGQARNQGNRTGSRRSTKAATAAQARGRARESATAGATVAEVEETPPQAAVHRDEAGQAERPETAAPTGQPAVALRFVDIRVPVPYVRVSRVSRPRVPLPSQHTIIVGAVRAADAVRDRIPARQDLIYYGGLGALAAFGVVEWPVAAAIGAGVWLVGRRGTRRESRPASEPKPGRTISTAKEPEPEPAAS
jgi:hypothetical protein